MTLPQHLEFSMAPCDLCHQPDGLHKRIIDSMRANYPNLVEDFPALPGDSEDSKREYLRFWEDYHKIRDSYRVPVLAFEHDDDEITGICQRHLQEIMTDFDKYCLSHPAE